MAHPTEFMIRSSRTLLPGYLEGRLAWLHIKRGKIVEVHSKRPGINIPILDFEDRVVMPGLVDSHVHCNEPGKVEWEGLLAATRAASAGGVTTIVDMPLYCEPPTTRTLSLRSKVNTALDQCWVDYAFWAGLVPGNIADIEPLVREGSVGFMTYLMDTGTAEFPLMTEPDLRKMMPALAQLGIPLLVHPELPTEVTISKASTKTYQSYLHSRPAIWEVSASDLMARLAYETNCHVHLANISSSEVIPGIVGAKKRGVRISTSTCPHYLLFSSEEIKDGETIYKCSPPIREKANREQLWEALLKGHIDIVVSGHSPCTPEMKQIKTGDFTQAWAGISGVQFSLMAMWTEMRKRGIPIGRLVQWMCTGPADLAGLGRRKGRIAADYDADLVIFDPDVEVTVTPDLIQNRHKLTAYQGQKFFGGVQKTFLRGIPVFDDGKWGDKPTGQRRARS